MTRTLRLTAKQAFSSLIRLGKTLMLAIAAMLVTAHANATEMLSVTLKPSIQVEASDIRIGDIFSGAGEAGMTVFGTAPSPGRTMDYGAAYIQAKARQAGLLWDNKDGLDTVRINRTGTAPKQGNAGLANISSAAPNAEPISPRTDVRPTPAADLKRGDAVMIIYRAPGIELLARGKATADASLGGKARATIMGSNKPVDGVLIAPGHIAAYSKNLDTPTQVASNSGSF